MISCSSVGHFPDLTCMFVEVYPVSKWSGSGLASMLLYLLRYSWHWPTIQVYFAIFTSVLIFLQTSAPSSFSSCLEIMDLMGNPRLPLPTLFIKKFRCCCSNRIVEVGDHENQIASSSISVANGANLLHVTIVVITVGSCGL